MREPHLKHLQIARLGRLLDMLYRPAEIAEEIGVTVDTVYRSYLPAGLPSTRDAQGSIWIHGPAFASWARETIARKKSKRKPLWEGQAWCVRCNRPVDMHSPVIRPLNRVIELQVSSCPICGTTINRGRRRVS
jgi:hypothetical protein